MSKRRSEVPALLALALLSTSVLALEVLQSRLVSYSVHVLLLYAVIGIAMLGFGAAGSLVALRSRWTEQERLPRVLAWAALCFSTGTVVAHGLFVRLTPVMQAVDGATLLVAALLALPFVAAGVVVTVTLSTAGPALGRAYAANLLGSGLGCFIPLWLLGPLTGPALLGLLGLLAWAAAAIYVRLAGARLRSPLGMSALGALVLAIASLTWAEAFFPVQPEPLPGGQLAGLYAHAAEHGIDITRRYDRWNVTGRIEIFQASGVDGDPRPHPAMFYAQDSTAGSSLLRWDGRTQGQLGADKPALVPRLCHETVYGLGYFRPRPKVLVIGLGGGPDLQCAVFHEARQVDVVEINPDSIAAVRGPFNDWLGGIGQHEAVRFHRRDGRSLVRARGGAGYDLIQLSGVDTKQNYASGALALAENHLYTREAFDDYLAALSPAGVITILRFGHIEALRLANTAVHALRAMGAEQPALHIAILGSGPVYAVTIGRSPLTPADVTTIEARTRLPNLRGADIYFYTDNGIPFDQPPVVHYLPSREPRWPFGAFFGMVARGAEASFDAGGFDIRPTTDDRPFFFDILRYDSAESWQQPHVIALRNVIASVALLSLLFILLPAFRLARVAKTEAPAPGRLRVRAAIYFGAIGLGFVLLEVWMLHRFSMFLGHQTYSLSVVLAALLVSTGLGAWGGGRLLPAPARRARVGSLAVVVWLLLGSLLLPWLLGAAADASLPVRCSIATAFVFPCGLAMGQPFVAGMTWLEGSDRGTRAWSVGINAFASVIASVGVIPLAMVSGYVASLGTGCSLYLLAALASLGMRPDSRH
ncbi:MAG: hypothetical protein OEZ06_25950 [Myxococcales bacterium]|nr:hypothetical protein [Myxococcales bacterium]